MTETIPKVSIIMVNYNGLKYLTETIIPIQRLNYSNYEFIVVDNGSTDGSIEFIQEHKDIVLVKSPRLREKNFACNYGVEKCTGEFILLLDNDCLIVDSNMLSELIHRAELNDDCGIIGLAFQDRGTTKTKGYGGFLNRSTYISDNRPISVDRLIALDNQLIGFPHGLAVFMKKSVWNELGGYDAHLVFGGDDTDIGIKSWLFGYKNYLYAKSVQLHIGLSERQDNKKYALKFKEMFFAHLYTIVKNYTVVNMLISLVGQSIFMFFKSIKQSVARRNINIVGAFFQGILLFFKNSQLAQEQRKYIQDRRKNDKDMFFSIKPAKLS